MHYNITEDEKEADTLAEWNIKSPLLTEMQILDCLSDTAGITTYLLKHEVSEKTFIFKSISVPESQTHVDGLRYSGAIQTAGEAQAYYENVVADLKAEIDTLKRLSDCGSIDGYMACHIQPKEEHVGFDIHLLAPCRKTLAAYIQQTPMTHLKAVNLALDLCTALKDLREAGYIHCNIKPENIYLNNQGHFMLGDLGLFRADQLKYAAIPERMLGKFSAPELFDIMQTPNTTVDIYTVALILYSIYNGGHSPFEDERTSSKGASEERLSGNPLPAPLYADYEMTGILLKACAYDPAERYETPEEFFDALTDYATRNQPQDDLIVPPIVVDDDTQLSEEALNEEVVPVSFTDANELEEDFVHHFSPDTEMHQEIVEAIQEEIAAEEAETANEETTETPEISAEERTEEPVAEETAEDEPVDAVTEKKPRKKFPVWAWITSGAVLLVAAALACVYFLYIPNVAAINVKDTGSAMLSFTVDSNKDITAFAATCKDTYGNVTQAIVAEDALVFEGLAPGTQYTVELTTTQGLPVRGIDTVLAATTEATEVLFFGAKPVSETQVELNFTIAGADLDTWTVEYGTTDADKKEVSFTGHTVVISDLVPNSRYMFTLLGSDSVSISGKTQLNYNSMVTVTVNQLLAQTTADGVTLTWAFTGEAPQQWHAICRGPEDFFLEQSTEEPKVSFTGLEVDKVYTIEIFCDGMAVAAEKTIHTSDATISGLTAEESNGITSLKWESQDELPDGWLVVCSLASDPSVMTAFHTQNTEAALTGLLPESTYNVEVQTGSGMKVNGESTLQIQTGKAVKFSDYGLTSTYVGLFKEPEMQNWTYRNLATPRTTFAAAEKIAFALEAMSGVRGSTDEVDIMIVVKNSAKTPVSTKTYTMIWDNMWDNKLFVGVPFETPQTAGKYTLEIYFNGGLAGSANLTVS